MNIENILHSLNRVKDSFNVYKKRPGKYQLISPILHEDGDMVDIYFQKSPEGENYIRICDYGMSLMRLSYNYEINTPAKKKIFNSILFNDGLKNENGNLFLDSPLDKIYESIFQFAGCVQKLCSMDYWSRETIQSVFYENLKIFILENLTDFKPKPDIEPLSEKIENKKETSVYKVDWSLTYNKRQFYLFGVTGMSKAKDSAIALLEFKKENLPFFSLVVHEDMQNLGNKELIYLTRNADKQYPSLNDFSKEGVSDIKRFVA